MRRVDVQAGSSGSCWRSRLCGRDSPDRVAPLPPNPDTVEMKVAIVFVLLFATVLCRPAGKPSDSSESSEEVVSIEKREGRRTIGLVTSNEVCLMSKQRRPPAPVYRKQVIAVPLNSIKVKLQTRIQILQYNCTPYNLKAVLFNRMFLLKVTWLRVRFKSCL